MIGFRQIDEEQVREIYHQYMEKDFPVPELKPLKSILRMMEDGEYLSLSILEDDIPCGYALLVVPKGIRYALLDYLAIFPAVRSTGIGGRVLPALAGYLPHLLITLESEYPQDAPNPELAARRLAFYQRSGCMLAPAESKIFGVHYALLAITGDEACLGEVASAMEEIYGHMVRNPLVRRKFVKIWEL